MRDYFKRVLVDLSLTRLFIDHFYAAYNNVSALDAALIVVISLKWARSVVIVDGQQKYCVISFMFPYQLA